MVSRAKEEVKSGSREVKSGSREVKSGSREVKSGSREVKSGSREVIRVEAETPNFHKLGLNIERRTEHYLALL
jgi:hypothetical protein